MNASHSQCFNRRLCRNKRHVKTRNSACEGTLKSKHISTDWKQSGVTVSEVPRRSSTNWQPQLFSLLILSSRELTISKNKEYKQMCKNNQKIWQGYRMWGRGVFLLMEAPKTTATSWNAVSGSHGRGNCWVWGHWPLLVSVNQHTNRACKYYNHVQC